ncbi:hypothetical protein ACFUIW_36375 [Streptomyces sp. NPDC057245]|uniref:hypothetical protein n=1 Tax=Streptomyces TaxID=1883 RepID=UPI001C1E755C|nr:hypothetical protein [Streptomyces sp. A108]MBU6532791.1 hypothetical protein [Streptomyces sp. A108]
MRLAPKLSCVTALVVAAVAGAATAAGAAGPAAQQVDGSLTVLGVTCAWADAATSADPPSTLTIDRASVNSGVSCGGGASATLNNDPTLTFDESGATATSDLIDITVNQSIVSCSYQASDAGWTGDGSTGAYQNQAFTASKTSGSFLCPSSVALDAGAVSLTFH